MDKTTDKLTLGRGAGTNRLQLQSQQSISFNALKTVKMIDKAARFKIVKSGSPFESQTCTSDFKVLQKAKENIVKKIREHA